MKGKTILITGGTSGIGRATARLLAGKGATVVFTYRSKEKADDTIKETRNQFTEANISGLEVDLNDLDSVRKMAAEFRTRHSRLDVLINNAGAYFSERETTPQGFEKTFALNHLSPFVLTCELMDLLKASQPARIINLSSEGHKMGTINFDDLMAEKSYSAIRAYGQSKLANIMFTKSLDRMLEGTEIDTYAVHPGVVATGFGLNTPGFFRFLVKLAQPFMRSPDKGAATSVMLASSPKVKGQSGHYWANKKQKKSNKESQDISIQNRLWKVSEELTGAHYPDSVG